MSVFEWLVVIIFACSITVQLLGMIGVMVVVSMMHRERRDR